MCDIRFGKTNPDRSPTNLVNAPPTRRKSVRSCECLEFSFHYSFTAVSASAFYTFAFLYISIRFPIYLVYRCFPFLMALRVVKTWVHHGNHENRVFSTRRRNEAHKASTQGKQKKMREIQISYMRFPKRTGNQIPYMQLFKPLKQILFSEAVSQ